MSEANVDLRDVWLDVDLASLPDYERWQTQTWYDEVDWAAATHLARTLIRVAIEVHAPDVLEYVLGALPPETPPRTQEGIWSFFREPIVATPEQITSGGHRITAMRSQGLATTVAVMTIDTDSDLASDPRLYPGQ